MFVYLKQMLKREDGGNCPFTFLDAITKLLVFDYFHMSYAHHLLISHPS